MASHHYEQDKLTDYAPDEFYVPIWKVCLIAVLFAALIVAGCWFSAYPENF